MHLGSGGGMRGYVVDMAKGFTPGQLLLELVLCLPKCNDYGFSTPVGASECETKAIADASGALPLRLVFGAMCVWGIVAAKERRGEAPDVTVRHLLWMLKLGPEELAIDCLDRDFVNGVRGRQRVADSLEMSVNLEKWSYVIFSHLMIVCPNAHRRTELGKQVVAFFGPSLFKNRLMAERRDLALGMSLELVAVEPRGLMDRTAAMNTFLTK
jgi:hypothetical protein